MKPKYWSAVSVSLAAIAALGMFLWPLFVSNTSASPTLLAQGVFIGLMPAVLLLILVEFGAGKLDSRSIAILGLLIALNAVIRLLGAGVSGIETAFFLIIIGAYVFGAGFGFILGAGWRDVRWSAAGGELGPGAHGLEHRAGGDREERELQKQRHARE